MLIIARCRSSVVGRRSSAWCAGREASQPAPHGRKANRDSHGPTNVGRTTEPQNHRTGRTMATLVRPEGTRFSVLCSWTPTNSGSPANKAKEPLPPRSVVQCAVASTPVLAGSGSACRWVFVHSPARAVFNWMSYAYATTNAAKCQILSNTAGDCVALFAGFNLTPLAIMGPLRSAYARWRKTRPARRIAPDR
jgi:hypothetical protein